MTDRAAARTDLRRRRASLSPAERGAASEAAAVRIMTLPCYRRARRIGLYAPIGTEIDVWPLVEASLRLGKRVFLPALDHGHMAFFEFRGNDALHSGDHGIPEPPRHRGPVAALSLDVAVVPLLGFDTAGHRLGQGGGHYDRYFARQIGVAWRRPILMGAAFEAQRCELIDTQHWDVSLHLVVTETSVYRSSAHR